MLGFNQGWDVGWCMILHQNNTHAMRPARHVHRARTVLVTGIGLAGLTLLWAVLLLWSDRQTQVRDWSHNIENVSTSLAAHAEQTFRAADLVLDTVQVLIRETGAKTAEDLVRVAGNKPLYDAMRQSIAGAPQVDVVTIIGASGAVLNFTRSYPAPPINLSDRDFFQAIMGSSSPTSYLGIPVENRGNGEWDFYLAHPILGRDGKAIGMLVAGIASHYFNDFYKAMQLGDYSAISLFRTDGVLLAREPYQPNMLGVSFKDDRIFQRMLEDSVDGHASIYSDPRLEPSSRDTTRLIAPHRLIGFPVVSNITVSEKVVLAGWRHTARNVTLLTLGLVAAMLCLTFALARVFKRQDETLRALMDAQREAEHAATVKGELLETLRVSEARLTEQSKVFQITLEHIDQGLLMVASDGTVPVCNRRAMELLDLPRSLMASRPLFKTVVEYQRSLGEFVTAIVKQTHVPGAATIMSHAQVFERTRPNGTILEIQTIPLAGGGMVRTFTDITARRKSEEQVRYYAHHDGLTELVNRMVFQQSLAEAIRQAQRLGRGVAVHYLDLDGFKQINDTHGHAVGDRLLVEVADRLRRAVRDADTVGRMGGDEFAILQPLSERRGAVEQLAQRILTVISEPYAIGELQCLVGLSIGISLYPDHALTPEDLLRDADAALYCAKAGGKGQFTVFDPSMDRRQQGVFQLEQELKSALLQDELFIEYQPIVDADTLVPTCFEALLRWRHSSRGIVPPGEFIALAERCGLIVPIGLWTLQTACAQAMAWPASVSLSVNVSPVQFSRGNLVAQVSDALSRSGLDARRLILEVTEGVLLEETETVLEAMASLRASGVRFSLDDFGTANSRLTYLRRFSFDIIKIDRSFVQDAVEEEGARAIVSAVLAIGRAFHLSVVAEGVERGAQLELLRAMGCELVQGYLTGAPAAAVPAHEFAELNGIEAETA
jgi:diguanylate cyclase (GGDEF)-like protein